MPHDIFKGHEERQKPILGAFVTFDSMPMVEIMSTLGFDYLGIDTQHAMLDTVQACKLMYAVPHELPVIVRVGNSEAASIGKLLDAGAAGVIVPMVDDAAEAARAVAACRYNPSGNRSFGPVRKHIGFDPAALQERAACFVMIETVEAVKNIDEIVATEGLTGVYFGAGDLAVNMGLVPAQRPSQPQIREAASRVGEACRRAGVIAGSHGQSVDHLEELVEAGFTMVTLSGDRNYIAQGATNMLQAGRKVGKAS